MALGPVYFGLAPWAAILAVVASSLTLREWVIGLVALLLATLAVVQLLTWASPVIRGIAPITLVLLGFAAIVYGRRRKSNGSMEG